VKKCSIWREYITLLNDTFQCTFVNVCIVYKAFDFFEVQYLEEREKTLNE